MNSQGTLFAPESSNNAGFTGRDLLRLVFKYQWVVLTCFIVVAGGSIYAGLRQPTLYIASGQVWIKTDQQTVQSFLSGVASFREPGVLDPPNRRMETELSALMNLSNVEEVIKEHSLTAEMLKQSPLDVAIAPLKLYIKTFSSFVERLFGTEEKAEEDDFLAGTVKAFLKSTTAEPVRSRGADVTSNIIEVTLSGTDRGRVQAALASLIQRYVERSSAKERELGRLASESLKFQTAEALVNLVTAENAAIKYTLRPGAPSPSSTQAARVAETTNVKLLADIETLQARLDVLRQNYGEEYTEVRTTRNALEQLRSRLVDQSRGSMQTDATIGVLERRRAVQEARYSELQRKLDQVNLYLTLAPTDTQGRLAMELPRQADKVKPIRKLLTLIGGPLVGLILGLALACFFDFADRRLQTRGEVFKHLGLETLAALPHIQSRYSSSEPTPSQLEPITDQAIVVHHNMPAAAARPTKSY